MLNIADNKGKAMTESAYLTGRLLLAMPGMADPRFHRAVIFICAHDANGAMGLVLNQPAAGVTLGKVLDQMNITANPGQAGLPVLTGGPVDNNRGFVLHTPDFRQPDTVRVNDDFCVTSTIDALKAVAVGKGPSNLLFMLGYSGWGAGQLEKELQENAWLVADPRPSLVFTTTASEKWSAAIKSLGFDLAMLSEEAGRA